MERKIVLGVGGLLLAIPLLLGSCTGMPKDVYDSAIEERDLARREASTLQNQLDAAQATIDTLRNDLKTLQERLNTLMPKSELKLTLNDVYYEKHHYEDMTSEVLVVELTLENKEREQIEICKSCLQDAEGTTYIALLLPTRSGMVEGGRECCTGMSRIMKIGAGEKTDGYLVVYEHVPRDANGLKVTIETNENGTSLAVLLLPGASLIRVLEVFETSANP
jgi:hypothetical protein